MNAIQKSLSDLRHTIPNQLLELAFVESYYNYRANNISLDERIRNTVIRPRVLVDCNLVGGMIMYVELGRCTLLSSDLTTLVYHIPKELTEGKSVMSALELSGTGMAGTYNRSTMARVEDSYGTSSYKGANRIQLISENTVVIHRTTPTVLGYLKVRVGNDENLSNISIRSHPAFSTLVGLSVKSYIYNKLYLNLDMTNVMAGYEASRISEIVESYSSSEEEYQEYLLNVWGKVSFCNDTTSHAHFIKMQINPAI